MWALTLCLHARVSFNINFYSLYFYILIVERHISSKQTTPEQLREHAGKACALFKALANEDRLMLLCQTALGRQNVEELEGATGIRQPSLCLASDNVVCIMRTLWNIYCAPT